MSAKELITKFYDLDFVKDNSVLSFFHDDFKMVWNSSKGVLNYTKNDIDLLIKDLNRNYHSYQAQVHQILAEGNLVTVSHSIYVTSIERPEKEDVLANFISILEIKDQKIYKINQISQLADH
jgi:hypothetical protein